MFCCFCSFFYDKRQTTLLKCLRLQIAKTINFICFGWLSLAGFLLIFTTKNKIKTSRKKNGIVYDYFPSLSFWFSNTINEKKITTKLLFFIFYDVQK